MFIVSKLKGNFGLKLFSPPPGIKVPSMGKWIANFSA
jgi:hypothetical protein